MVNLYKTQTVRIIKFHHVKIKLLFLSDVTVFDNVPKFTSASQLKLLLLSTQATVKCAFLRDKK